MNPVQPDHRKAVVKYDTEEELQATNEWLMKWEEAELSEELLYLPSQLSKLGVAPKDVADQLDWLKQHRPGFDQPTTVLAVLRGTARLPVEQEVSEDVESVTLETEEVFEDVEVDIIVGESEILVLDYDGDRAWEWLKPIEKMIEGSALDNLIEEPGLPSFNNALVVLTRSVQPHPEPKLESQPTPQARTRGKMARAARAAQPPESRAEQ